MNKTLTVTPSKKEWIWGFVYLLTDILLLPTLVTFLVQRFHISLSAGQLNGILFLINFVVVTFIFRRFLAKNWENTRGKLLRTVFTAVRGYLVYWACALAVSMIIVAVDPNFANVNDNYIVSMAAQDFGIIAFSTIILVPITEELLFRGILFAGLYNRSRWAAFAVSMVLFSLIHITGYIGIEPPKTLFLCFLQYLPAGFALGWCYVKSDNFFAPVLLHTFVNAIGTLAMR